MDPDNRRDIEYALLQKALVEQDSCKLRLTKQLLCFRREYKKLFLEGEYLPLVVYKERRENCIAFLRRQEEEVVFIAAGRFFTQLPADPIGKEAWGETEIILSPDTEGEYVNVLTDKKIRPQKKGGRSFFHAADLFSDHPVAVLHRRFY